MELNPKILFIPSTVPVSDEQISAFEASVGFKFPTDYRKFLKFYNGPKMAPQDRSINTSDFALAIDLRNLGGITSQATRNAALSFFQISRWTGFADPDVDHRYGLIEQYEVTSADWNLPKSVVPIAGNVGTAKVYLNLSDDAWFGHVLLVGDTLFARQADGLEIRVEDFVTIASSFGEFVAKLEWINVASS